MHIAYIKNYYPIILTKRPHGRDTHFEIESCAKVRFRIETKKSKEDTIFKRFKLKL